MQWFFPLRFLQLSDIRLAVPHLLITIWSFVTELFLRDCYANGELAFLSPRVFLAVTAIEKTAFLYVCFFRMGRFSHTDAFLCSLAMQVAIMSLLARPLSDTTFWPGALFAMTVSLLVYVRAVLNNRAH